MQLIVVFLQTLRPHPDRLKMDDENEEVESEDDVNDDNASKAKSKKYVPPKLMAVHYNDIIFITEDEEEMEERKIERARRRALQSSLIQDLRAQYSEAPEEFQDDSIIKRKKQEDIEKQKYEEDYLIRLQMTKKEKHNKKIQNRQDILDELLHFGSYMAMKDTEKGGDNKADRGAGRKRKIGKNKKFAKKPRLVKGKKVK
ncbi:unnamed protein product [Onchocerca flexuosa]|uniref:Protein SDA1 n=1 Tax=Onchocerca flexuosa TaxID=387005 RepID=A0A183HFV5_9BILA|nr:unnamed protein product [Onchocerca flexuosa]